MVAHADAEAGSKPDEKDEDGEIAPTEHEQGGDGSHVEKRQNDGRDPVDLSALRNPDVGGYPFVLEQHILTLTRIHTVVGRAISQPGFLKSG